MFTSPEQKPGDIILALLQTPRERIIKHNQGKGSQLAAQQGPFTLVYTSKPLLNKSEARKREIQIKGWSREKKEKLINGEWK